MEKRLILSQIQTPDGTILRSMHVHDYVTHLDKNGEEYMLDGGNEYQRYNLNKEPFKDLSIWSNAPYEIIRENFHRGGRGKNNDEPLKWVPMSEMSNEWLENCITYNKTLYGKLGENSFPNKMYQKELDYRKENNIFIED